MPEIKQNFQISTNENTFKDVQVLNINIINAKTLQYDFARSTPTIL